MRCLTKGHRPYGECERHADGLVYRPGGGFHWPRSRGTSSGLGGPYLRQSRLIYGGWPRDKSAKHPESRSLPARTETRKACFPQLAKPEAKLKDQRRAPPRAADESPRHLAAFTLRRDTNYSLNSRPAKTLFRKIKVGATSYLPGRKLKATMLTYFFRFCSLNSFFRKSQICSLIPKVWLTMASKFSDMVSDCR